MGRLVIAVACFVFGGIAFADSAPLTNITVGTTAADDAFATCVAQAATTQVIDANAPFTGFVFKGFDIIEAVDEGYPVNQVSLDFWANTPGGSGASLFYVRFTSDDTQNGWQISQDAGGKWAAFSTSVDSTGYVAEYTGEDPINLGPLDLSSCQ